MSASVEARLARAERMVRDAYRDSARLVRLLSVISRSATSADALLRSTLEAVSTAFDADLVAVVRSGAAGSPAVPHVVVASCGFPRHLPPQLPDLPAAVRPALVGEATGGAGSWHAGDGGAGAEPLLVAGVAVRSAARLVLDVDDAAAGAILVLRSDPAPFSPSELQQLQSVVERLHVAVLAIQGRHTAEVLASVGDSLTRHLDGGQLLSGAADLLLSFTGAEWVGVLEVRDGLLHLGAERSTVGLVTAGPARWPKPCDGSEGWSEVGAGRTYARHDLSVTEHAQDLPETPVRSTLVVPVVVEGSTVAVLAAIHATPSAFSAPVRHAVGQLSGHLATALVSARLYQALACSEAELRHRATHDALTGLANRSLLLDELARRLADADPDADAGGAHPDGQVGVLFCDLDGFKGVNDRHGHAIGDRLLRLVADRLSHSVRAEDLMARIGGDEFVLLVDGVPDRAGLVEVGRRLLAVLDEPFALETSRGQTELVRIGCSIGAAIAPRGDDASRRASELLRDADDAMYDAKRAGGGDVLVADEDAARRAQRVQRLTTDLPPAIAAGQLHVEYQPVWDLVGDRMQGVEALVRWTHPELGRVGPDEFVPIAERTGEIVALGRFVLRTACEALALWRAQGSDITLSVNASPVELRRPDFVAEVLAVLADAGLEPGHLVLEVTEGLPLGGPELERVAALRATGIRALVDDFGVSHSDLARLKALPVDGLKIDKSLVDGLAAGPGSRPLDVGLVEAILVLARAGGLSVTAEGVETAEQRDMLVSLGCRTAQGWLTGRPVVADVISAHLAAAREPVPVA